MCNVTFFIGQGFKRFNYTRYKSRYGHKQIILLCSFPFSIWFLSALANSVWMWLLITQYCTLSSEPVFVRVFLDLSLSSKWICSVKCLGWWVDPAHYVGLGHKTQMTPLTNKTDPSLMPKSYLMFYLQTLPPNPEKACWKCQVNADISASARIRKILFTILDWLKSPPYLIFF